jgi:trans-aconitate 2-methyltransferase
MRKWDTSLYDQKHAFVFKYGEELIGVLDPQRGERILDVGCGTGHLTSRISDRGAYVRGIDNSVEMIESARAAYPQIDFRVADAADFAFPEPFDGVFSNAALHWVKRSEDAVICMSRVLRPGGRFVVEFGGFGNVRRIYTAIEAAVKEVLGNGRSGKQFLPEHWRILNPASNATDCW